MSGKIAVGISDYKTSKSPDTLVTYALGSCVGIFLYDPASRIGGLSHIMLPSSSLRTNDAADNRMKYADTAISDMLASMESLGAGRDFIHAKIAGGANMFGKMDGSFIDTIGDRNVDAVRQELARLGIPLIAEDVGANYGRTVHFNLKDGSVEIQSIGKEKREL
ncbi:MAG: chemotaxis protein CheD [Clostridiales Family XIII bacterium]|jgi:chemotaxis protein CheD|nr:chemotaxis protein CheD [Clostridiales Family XIII bacterium]